MNNKDKMKIISAYQKQKLRIQQLENDLREVCLNYGSSKSIELRHKYMMEGIIEKESWKGDATELVDNFLGVRRILV